ncbi:hypothetical protein DBA26_15550 [Brucella canis]|uniref:Uncharacterized protein n=3 Tax=Brucella TaxID=234 RepID=A0AAI8E7L5_BRUSS|nr:protein yicc [Brucella ovis ATCC 25840]ASU72221.1 hypothetical protein CJP69_08520 [Brucella abortus]ATN20054.1 hypothetical protein CRN66_09440 [Brucella canis]ATQ51567.1 hypothetical protein CS875_02335 [Brucella suis]EEX79862.1 predicted protein [Brucella abortus bv. 9 str. C68]EEX86916.1 predicted protein [Brucella ceti B1/94]EEZ30634.1 predicted protein [Brucella pinnipedialis M292/94/1]
MFVAFSNAKPFRNFAGNALNAMNPEPVMNRLDPVPATVERKAHGAPEHDRFCAPCSTAWHGRRRGAYRLGSALGQWQGA